MLNFIKYNFYLSFISNNFRSYLNTIKKKNKKMLKQNFKVRDIK